MSIQSTISKAVSFLLLLWLAAGPISPTPVDAADATA